MKQVYRKVYTEYLNNATIYVDYGLVRYDEVTEKDNEVLTSDDTNDIDIFKYMVKSGKVKSREFEVVTRRGKDILKYYNWDFSHKYNEKDFEEYCSNTRIEYCNYYTIKQLRDSLPAEQYIDWCKDHGVTDDNIKLEF